MEPDDLNKQTSPMGVQEVSTPNSTSEAAVSVQSTDANSKSQKASKKIFGKIGVIHAVIISVFLLVAGSAAAYLTLVVPNQPDTIWKTALSNTAEGYDQLVAYGENNSDTTGGTIKGTFKLESPDVIVDGNIDGMFDQKNSNINLDAGASGMRLKFNVLTNIPEGASSPDIYIKAEGLDGLANLLGAGDPSNSEMLASLNNQYFFIDHTLIDQFQKQATGADASGVSQLKKDDVVDFMTQLGEINKEYVFTSDSEKAIFTVKEEVGKETVDGQETYHFKVGLHKEHLKLWNQAVCDKLSNHKLMKLLARSENDDESKKNCEDTTDIDSFDENQSADVWVDLKTKLISTVRITAEDPKSTTEFGLLYKGGDEYPFYVTVKDEEQGNITFKIILNRKTESLTVSASGDFNAADGDSNLSVNLVFQPGNETVEFTKPEGAKSLSDLLAPFFGGLSNPNALDQSFSEEDFIDLNLE